MKLAFVLIVALIIIIVAPIATIAAINILAGSDVPVTIWTWTAAFWLNWLATSASFKKGE